MSLQSETWFVDWNLWRRSTSENKKCIYQLRHGFENQKHGWTDGLLIKSNQTFVKLSWFWRISNKLTENSKFLTLILNDVTKTPTAIVLETSKICFYAKSERSSTPSHWFRFKFTIHFTKFTKCILNHKIMLLSLICLCFLSYVYKNEIRRYPTQHLIPAVWCNLAFCIWFWPLSWDLHPKRF